MSPPAGMSRSAKRKIDKEMDKIEEKLRWRSVLIMECGHSKIRAVRGAILPQQMDWKTVRQTQEDFSAHAVLICGAPQGAERTTRICKTLFPGWKITAADTDGSCMVVLVNNRSWSIENNTIVKLSLIHI